MTGKNIVSVSWGDHLQFGEGTGRLASVGDLDERLSAWRDQLDAAAVHWRTMRQSFVGTVTHGDGRTIAGADAAALPFDERSVVPDRAHTAGFEAWLYVTLLDQGRPLPEPAERQVSYHNAEHGRDVAWQSDFCRDHSEWLIIDRDGAPQWGVFCLAYPEVRRHFIDEYIGLLHDTGFDGLFLCLRSQSKPPDHADRFGFNRPVLADYMAETDDEFDLETFDRVAWRKLHGAYLSQFLIELREEMQKIGVRLGIGISRGDIIGPPLGNWPLEWQRWIAEGTIDHLVIGQNSSRCPSMWLDLWPMHRGEGYLQNYLDGSGMAPLSEQIAGDYGPALTGQPVDLYIARQWHNRDRREEAELLSAADVSGLVFSSFRHDNPGALERGDWRITER